MMNKVTFDTSFVLAYLQPTDQHHHAAIELIDDLQEPIRVILPGVVLVEVSQMIKKSKDAKKIITDFVKEVYDVVEIDRKYLPILIDFIEDTNFRLKPNDYSVLHVAHMTDSLLLTFDDRLKNAYLKLKKENL